MRRLALTALVFASTAVGACSLINAPADEIPGSGGAGGAPSTASVTASASSSSASAASSSASTTGAGGAMCMGTADCVGHADECNDGVCSAGVCTKLPKADGTTCNDGLFCTTADVCTAGVCAGVAKVCPEMVGTTSSTGAGGGTGTSGAGGGATGTGGGPGIPVPDACHVWSCNEGLKVCEIVPGTSGTTCDDGDPCTTGELCAPDGSCGNGLPTDCSALNSECATGKCTPGIGCELVPTPGFDGFPCDVMNKCATSKCMAGKCSLVSPTNTGGPCDDKVNCTKNDVCQPNGFCGGTPKCVSLNPCTDAACDEAAGGTCTFPGKVDGSPCVLADPCAAGNVCQGGSCGGGTQTQTYFYEPFENNNKGWLLGPEWGIAPAVASPPGAPYGADPAQDHSPVGNNGIAGVVIGGNENPVIHAPYYIESSIIDVTAATGELYLTYYRWLNSDYLPYMRNMVEVFDGTMWVEVWTSGNPPGIQDSPPVGAGWTFQSHNITMYKNPNLKVRFGYEIKASGVFTIGSWNLDDVKLQNIACPTVP
jgi:hypothetical protein